MVGVVVVVVVEVGGTVVLGGLDQVAKNRAEELSDSTTGHRGVHMDDRPPLHHRCAAAERTVEPLPLREAENRTEGRRVE